MESHLPVIYSWGNPQSQHSEVHREEQPGSVVPGSTGLCNYGSQVIPNTCEDPRALGSLTFTLMMTVHCVT